MTIRCALNMSGFKLLFCTTSSHLKKSNYYDQKPYCNENQV